MASYFNYGLKEIDFLKKQDPVIGRAIDRIGPIERVVIPEIFPALIFNIIGQQISTKAAHTLWNRMTSRFGQVTPEAVMSVTEQEIQSFGMTLRKAVVIKAIASVVASGALNLSDLSTLSDDEVIQKLTGLRGIGLWTAEMMLILCMERPDVLSWGDLAIRRGMSELYGLENLTKSQFESYRKTYSPFGSVASLYLWAISKETSAKPVPTK
ncbi:MAG: DNA-3-methyladenine glycosylase [Erysipelotrichaceae bacterium]|nr:DNA-3-methyladenine glycosylase [Erysipelotrichaceae bacterium]